MISNLFADALVMMSTKNLVGISVGVAVVIVLLVVALVLFAIRHHRLQKNFLSFANSHYDTRSGAATFSTGDELGKDFETLSKACLFFLSCIIHYCNGF